MYVGSGYKIGHQEAVIPPFSFKVNLKPAPSIWLSASRQPSADFIPTVPCPFETYRHVDLFLFPSVCGHSAKGGEIKLLVAVDCERTKTKQNKKCCPCLLINPLLRKRMHLDVAIFL